MEGFPEKLQVLIVSAAPSLTQKLTEILAGENAEILCTDCAREARRLLVSSGIDIALINTPLPDEFGHALALEAEENFGVEAMLLVKSEASDEFYDRLSLRGIAVVPKPTARANILLAYRLLAATHRKLRKLRQKTESLTTQMDDIRMINRAKLLLVEKLRMSEEEAHRYIERQAMDTCRRKRAVAEQIIRTYEE